MQAISHPASVGAKSEADFRLPKYQATRQKDVLMIHETAIVQTNAYTRCREMCINGISKNYNNYSYLK